MLLRYKNCIYCKKEFCNKRPQDKYAMSPSNFARARYCSLACAVHWSDEKAKLRKENRRLHYIWKGIKSRALNRSNKSRKYYEN